MILKAVKGTLVAMLYGPPLNSVAQREGREGRELPNQLPDWRTGSAPHARRAPTHSCSSRSGISTSSRRLPSRLRPCIGPRRRSSLYEKRPLLISIPRRQSRLGLPRTHVTHLPRMSTCSCSLLGGYTYSRSLLEQPFARLRVIACQRRQSRSLPYVISNSSLKLLSALLLLFCIDRAAELDNARVYVHGFTSSTGIGTGDRRFVARRSAQSTRHSILSNLSTLG